MEINRINDIDEVYKLLADTSFHKNAIYATYYDLCKVLGKPDFTERNPREKNQFLWVVNFNYYGYDYTFTIYDWKEYRLFRKSTLIPWHIGGKDFSVNLERKFISFIADKISEL